MSETEPYFPLWLNDAIVEDLLPWESGKTCSYSEFAETYTLHDSSWISLNANIRNENSAVLAFLWDAHWIPDEIFKSTLDVSQWPFLFIKLGSLEEIVTRGVLSIDYDRQIDGSHLVEFETGLKTFVVASDGGDLEIGFRGDMTFLGLDREKQPISL